LIVVYVAGPFTAPNAWEVHRNVCRAESLALAVAEAGAMPLCPHTNTQHFHGTLPPAFWYDGTLELLRRCDAIILVPGWEASKGTQEEVVEAKRRGMPVFERVEELKAWLETSRG
jgi:nucleoside 2-deoxyribosyltransferase